MTERHTAALLIALAAFGWGCPGDPARDGGTGGEVLIGTGGIGRYEGIEDGDTVLMARGCQGGQHVWLGIRSRGIDTEPALVSASAIRVDDMAMVSIPTTLRLRFEQDVEDGWDQITGIQLMMPIPDDVIDRDIDIHVRVAEDRPGGQRVEAERRVHVVWGDEVCGGALGDGGALDGDGGLVPRGDAGEPVPDAGEPVPDGGSPDGSL